MNFDLSEEQEMLRDSANRFLSKAADSAAVRKMESSDAGYSREIWTKMAELGWTGLLIPEAYGGGAMTLSEMAVVLEAIGRAALPGPFFSSAVLATLLVIEFGNEEQKREWLPGLATGETIMTAAWQDRGASASEVGGEVTAICDGEDYLLTGSKLFVPYAHVADGIIVAVRTVAEDGDVSLFMLDARAVGLTIDIISSSSGEKECALVLDRVRVPRSNLLGPATATLADVFQKCAVAKCAEMLGGADKVLSMTVEYAIKREQFGKPIGSFQAIQHHCANMKTSLETSQLVTARTCWLISQGKPWRKQAAMCKAWVGESYKKITSLGHQVMGGLGFMEEADHQLYYRRARFADALFGNSDYQRELVAREMGL